jgi:Spy/CpxP family protein refolding chaperone
MMTVKALLVLILGYLLALAAGTTSGLLAERLHENGAPDNSLAAQLQLTPAQVGQMRDIWQRASRDMDGYYRQAQDINRQRDQALFNLLTDDQKAKFAAMDKRYSEQFQTLTRQRDEAFDSALAKTEQCLSDEQRTKYQQIVRERIGRDPFHAGATTEPSSAQSLDELRP